jgi:putative endonuclease
LIKKIGQIGEKIAADYLKSNGYRIVDRNYRCFLGEIDIIAQKKGCVHFIEVKAKQNSFLGEPEHMVDFRKRQKLISLANYYIAQQRNDKSDYQIDVITLKAKGNSWQIKHIKKAIYE